jgi:tRNA (guanosine-2'-O-)-methyltransferase
MRATLDEAWDLSIRTPEDPGLRDRYHTLPRAPIRLIACPLEKDVNQGGLLRLAEAFRLERVDFTPEPDGAVDMAAHLGTKSRQPYRWIPADQAVAKATEEGYHTVALTLNPRAVPLDRIRWQFPLAIVIGAELDGVPTEIERNCQQSVAIPLYGLVQSLNVTMASAIVVQHALSRYVEEHPEFVPARAVSRRLLGLEE